MQKSGYIFGTKRHKKLENEVREKLRQDFESSQFQTKFEENLKKAREEVHYFDLARRVSAEVVAARVG